MPRPGEPGAVLPHGGDDLDSVPDHRRAGQRRQQGETREVPGTARGMGHDDPEPVVTRQDRQQTDRHQ